MNILNIPPKGAKGTLPARRANPSGSPNKGTTSLWGKRDLRMCCQFPRKGQGWEHLASSFHWFSSRSTQQQPPDTFTFGPTQSDPKYPHNNGLQERSRLSISQGNEIPGSPRGDNSARAALDQSRGVGVPLFQSSAAPRHSLAHTRLFLRHHKILSLADVTRVPGELTAGAGQSPGIPSPFGDSFGEIFLWVVAPFICKHICKPTNDLDYPSNCRSCKI